jgi:hypothetical protein
VVTGITHPPAYAPNALPPSCVSARTVRARVRRTSSDVSTKDGGWEQQGKQCLGQDSQPMWAAVSWLVNETTPLPGMEAVNNTAR